MKTKQKLIFTSRVALGAFPLPQRLRLSRPFPTGRSAGTQQGHRFLSVHDGLFLFRLGTAAHGRDGKRLEG